MKKFLLGGMLLLASGMFISGCRSSDFDEENSALKGDGDALHNVYLRTRATVEDEGIYYRWMYIGAMLGTPQAEADMTAYSLHCRLSQNPAAAFDFDENAMRRRAEDPDDLFAAFSLFQYYLLHDRPDDAAKYRERLEKAGTAPALTVPIHPIAPPQTARKPYRYFIQRDRRNLLARLALQGDVKSAQRLQDFYSHAADGDKYLEFKAEFWTFVVNRLNDGDAKLTPQLAELLMRPEHLTPGALLKDNLPGLYERYLLNLVEDDWDVADTFIEPLKEQKLSSRLFFEPPPQSSDF